MNSLPQNVQPPTTTPNTTSTTANSTSNTASSTTSSTASTSSSQSTTTSSSATSTTSTTSNTANNNSNTSNDPVIPTNAIVATAIQTIPNWQWCTAELNRQPCASGLGNATSSMTPEQASPSLSGKSALFAIGGKTQYSNALWWQYLPSDSQSTHFVYDLYFYVNDPSAPEALEFDVNQNFGGVRFVWGTECSYQNTKHWDIWNSATGKWVTTQAPCPQVAANQWHHLIWQFERVNGKEHYISVTLDNNVMPVDLYFSPQQPYSGDGISVAFQMDGDYRQQPYNVWLDNVTLNAW